MEKARSRREERAQDDENSGKYIEVGLNTELLGVIIGKKRANLTSVMEATGTAINVDNETGMWRCRFLDENVAYVFVCID